MGSLCSRSAALALVAGAAALLLGCGGNSSPPFHDTPNITGIFPSNAKAGGAGFTMNVSGTGLISASVAFWNNSKRPTTFNPTTTQLAVSITAQDIASAGIAQVTVFNPPPGGGASSAVFFTINPALGSGARPAADFSRGDFPQVVSINALGGPADGRSAAPAISADGRFVAFYSNATNLVAAGGSGNIFIRDTCLGVARCRPETMAVDLAPDGGAPDGAAFAPVSISADGRFVAFASMATNLLPGSRGHVLTASSNVFVRDTCVGPDSPANCVPHTTELSVDPDGNDPNGASTSPSLSGNGRFVAFRSEADNLAASGSANSSGIYVRDTCAGSTAPKSCLPATFAVRSATPGALESQPEGQPAVSADGRYVVSTSSVDPVASLTRDPVTEIFLGDTCLGPTTPRGCEPSTTEISVAPDGSFGNSASQNPSVSADGRFVAFESRAANLVPGQSVGAQRVYLRDTCLGAGTPSNCLSSTTLIPASPAMLADNADLAWPWISPSGRYITFLAQAREESLGRSSGLVSLYVYDACVGVADPCTPQLYPILASSAGSPLSLLTVDRSTRVPLTSDGRFAAFSAPYAVSLSPLSGHGDVILDLARF
jgi:hypothetical protein